MTLTARQGQRTLGFAAHTIRGGPRRALGCMLLLMMASAQTSEADTRIVLQSASDWIYHGTTETFSQATVGVSAEWQGDSPFFIGVEAHQAVTPGTQQRHRALMGYIGYSLAFGSQWHGSAVFARRSFPGSFKEWDYNELKLELAHQAGWSFKLDYADDYYDHSTRALVGQAGYTRRFTDRAYGYAEAGSAQLSSTRFSDYEFARIGAGLSKSRVNIDLSYGWNSEDETPLFGTERIRSPELLLQFSYQLR